MNTDNKMYIVGRTGRWQATAHEVKEMFGLKQSDAWPAEGMPKREIQGFICWIDPLVPGGKFRLRARFFCGVCGDEVPIGRGVQHAKKHKHPESRE